MVKLWLSCAKHLPVLGIEMCGNIERENVKVGFPQHFLFRRQAHIVEVRTVRQHFAALQVFCVDSIG